MVNSFCCGNFDQKNQIIMNSDLLYETFEVKTNQTDKKKELQNDLNSNRNLKHNFSFQKSTNTNIPQSIDENDFINPLPEIVIIKLKKH